MTHIRRHQAYRRHGSPPGGQPAGLLAPADPNSLADSGAMATAESLAAPDTVAPTKSSATVESLATGDSMADVVERLFVSFEAQLGLPTIVRVVRRCRRELDIISGPPLPELLERLARQRLIDLAAETAPDSAAANPSACA